MTALTDRTDPRWTPAQLAHLAEFEAAPAIPESWEGSNALADHFENGFEAEESVDLTPGVVWTDGQLEVVRHLVARIHKAEQALRRVEALADELDWLVNDETVDQIARVSHAWTAHRIRAALTGEPR